MKNVIYNYQITDTLNNQVNQRSLHLYVKQTAIVGYVETRLYGPYEIHIVFENAITDDEKVVLDNIVSQHEGKTAKTEPEDVNRREETIREMTEMALIHPALSSEENQDLTVSYLTIIDNYLNAWKRSGVNRVIISKITTDAQDIENVHYNYLNTVVNEIENRKVFEFLIGSITAEQAL